MDANDNANDNDEMLARFRAYRASGNPAIREALILAPQHQALVRHWARHYHVRGWSVEDLEQEGQMGLIRAVDRYDPDGLHQGKPFYTVASFAIRKQLWKSVGASIDEADTVPLPTITLGALTAPDWLQDRVTRELPALEPSVEEQVMSHVDGAQVGSTLEAALLLLSERQRTIIERRYGLGGDGHVWTLEEIGRLLGLHKSNVCRQQQKALSLLRAELLQSDDGVLALRTMNEHQRAVLASQRKKVA